MEHLSVKQLSKIAGVSARTLRYYDQIGLLKPQSRTEAGYRHYGEGELLRLQQILFYRELDFPLQDIGDILDDPDFDLVTALSNHKLAMEERRQRIDTLIATIDKTITNQLKTNNMSLTPEELYDGLSKETAENYRKGAIDAYGKPAVEQSEKHLMQLGKSQFDVLKKEQQDVTKTLFSLIHEDHTGQEVQSVISRHYDVTRQFWGTHHSPDKQGKQYAGLGELYINDERFTMIDGKPQPEFAQFLNKAMAYFAANQLK